MKADEIRHHPTLSRSGDDAIGIPVSGLLLDRVPAAFIKDHPGA